MFKRHVLKHDIIAYEMGIGKNPPMTVWCYRVGKTLIDSGTPNMISRFLPVLLEDGGLTDIIVTHHHEDHSGCASTIREKTGAKIWLSQYTSPLTNRGFRQYPYQYLFWGKFTPYRADKIIELKPYGSSIVRTSDGGFEVIHAPGHSHDMTVIYNQERSCLFSADLFLSTKLRVMRRDEVWLAFEKSLGNLLDQLEFELLLCGHRPRFQNGYELLEKKYNWMRSSRSTFLDLLSEGLSEREATAKIFGTKKSYFDYITFGNVTKNNLAKSLQNDLKPRPDISRAVGEAMASCQFEV